MPASRTGTVTVWTDNGARDYDRACFVIAHNDLLRILSGEDIVATYREGAWRHVEVGEPVTVGQAADPSSSAYDGVEARPDDEPVGFKLTPVTAGQIARVCHEVNRAYQRATAEPVGPSWDDASEDMRQSAITGVRVAALGADPQQMHDSWCVDRMAHGWSYGPEKDADLKTHPALVSYDALPEQQRVKDRLFLAVVEALTQ